MKKIVPIFIVVVLLMLFLAPASQAAPPAWGGDYGDSYYCVRYGDTLFSIGRRYGVNPYYIAQVNGLRNPNRIYAGQVLYIPAGRGYGDGYQRYPSYDRGYQRYPYYDGGYGYDYTGYYYDGYFPEYRRYSYTCGYHYNCY